MRASMKLGCLALAAAFAIGAPSSAAAKKKPKESDATLTGIAIIDKMLAQDPLGFGGADARVLMVLVDEAGNERKRNMDMLTRKDDKTRRSFVRFTAPADIAGTAFLSIDDDGDRVQHLYMPALERTRRIASNQRNARFVGTDYSYADMDNRDLADATKKRLPDENVGAQPSFVVEAIPTDKSSEYARIVVWVSKANLLPLRIRFYDGNKKEIKRLTVQEVKKITGPSGAKWIITESKMVDLKREHTTVMKVVDVKLRQDVPLDQFTVRTLERG